MITSAYSAVILLFVLALCNMFLKDNELKISEIKEIVCIKGRKLSEKKKYIFHNAFHCNYSCIPFCERYHFFFLDNAIPIKSWFSDARDTALLCLLPMLDALRFTNDVRSVLSRNLHLHRP